MGVSTRELLGKIFRRGGAGTVQPTPSKTRKALQSPTPENYEIAKLRKAAAAGDASAIIALRAREKAQRNQEQPPSRELVDRGENERRLSEALRKNASNSY